MDQIAMNGKALKFRTAAERRVSNVLKTIRSISKLSRRGDYDYRPEQIERMFAAIRHELEVAEKKFAPRSAQALQAPLFKLD